MVDVTGLLEVYGTLGERAAGRPRERSPVENKVWYLRQNRLFAQSGDAAIESSQHIFQTSVFPRRAMVFDVGDPTRLVYLVKRGRVRIARLSPDGKEIILAVLGPGDMFGEETLFNEPVRTTVAVCMEETLLCTAKADDLFALLSQNPQLALNVAQVLNDRLGDASAAMEDLAYAKVPDRIVNLFERLAVDYGLKRDDGIYLDVRLTHADIASLVGSTRETVTLEMSNLARAGRIKNENGYITLHEATK